MTKEQERARAKRRYERQQVREAEKAAEAKRTRQVAIVTAVILAMVGLFVVIAKTVGDGAAKESAGGASASSSGPGAEPSAALAAGCEAPPAVPGNTGELSKPSAEEVKAASKTITATIATNCGDIVVDLDGGKAPQAVASFLQLARTGYWQNAPCHRLTTEHIFVLQCGDPTGTSQGSPGYSFGLENTPRDNVYKRGVLAMARPENNADGNGGQYFIVYQDSTIPADDVGGYTVFGTVTEGLDIVDKIAAGGVAGGGADGSPTYPISTLAITTETKD